MQNTATREDPENKPVFGLNDFLFGCSYCHFYLANPDRLNSASLRYRFSKKAPASGGSCCWSFSDWLELDYYKYPNSQCF
tara:strand:- start:464 stop:703 length:240 start_codon:yes stop_codon:yes gene_type:complete